jgi:deoxyribodipyrimidine photolyase-related protein
MTLNEYDPVECFDWFMTMFIDSYEWVMVANVFGMGLYADGGIFATKPYVAGGNYLKKMSDYQSGKGEQDWEKIWTNKFWYFILKHEKVFSTNPRMAMLITSRKNKSKFSKPEA